MKILIICGSRRKNSLTRKLTDIAFEHAKKNHKEVSYLDLGKADIDDFKGFEEKYSENTMKAVKLVEGSDVIIIGSPIYNGFLSSGVKNLFEFINYKALEGKVAGFILKSGTQASWRQAHEQLVALMNYFNVISNPRPVFASDEDFNEKGELNNDEVRKRIENLVDSTIDIKRKLSS
jgi:FMN reductase